MWKTIESAPRDGTLVDLTWMEDWCRDGSAWREVAPVDRGRDMPCRHRRDRPVADRPRHGPRPARVVPGPLDAALRLTHKRKKAPAPAEAEGGRKAARAEQRRNMLGNIYQPLFSRRELRSLGRRHDLPHGRLVGVAGAQRALQVEGQADDVADGRARHQRWRRRRRLEERSRNLRTHQHRLRRRVTPAPGQHQDRQHQGQLRCR